MQTTCEPALDAASTASNHPPGATYTGFPDPVLLVTAHHVDQWPIRRQLDTLGYPVLAAASGPAVHIVERNHGSLHLLLTDLFVPARSGHTLVEAIARYRSEIPILVMVERPEERAFCDRHYREMAAILKPFTASTLKRGIAAALQIQRTLKYGHHHSPDRDDPPEPADPARPPRRAPLIAGRPVATRSPDHREPAGRSRV